jgi:hypothetical protein
MHKFHKSCDFMKSWRGRYKGGVEGRVTQLFVARHWSHVYRPFPFVRAFRAAPFWNALIHRCRYFMLSAPWLVLLSKVWVILSCIVTDVRCCKLVHVCTLIAVEYHNGTITSHNTHDTHNIKFASAQQAKIIDNYKNIKERLHKVNAAIMV